jgi:hypothetical protein
MYVMNDSCRMLAPFEGLNMCRVAQLINTAVEIGKKEITVQKIIQFDL